MLELTLFRFLRPFSNPLEIRFVYAPEQRLEAFEVVNIVAAKAGGVAVYRRERDAPDAAKGTERPIARERPESTPD